MSQKDERTAQIKTETDDILEARRAMSQGAVEKARHSEQPARSPRVNPIEETARAEMLLNERLEMSPSLARLSGMIEGDARRSGPPAIVMGLDATASRSHTWEMAKVTQKAMFKEAAAKNLIIKLGFYRGTEVRIGKRWIACPREVARVMDGIGCVAGMTQFARLLRQVLNERSPQPQALVFVGDCFEEEIGEAITLASVARSLGIRMHMFHEGDNIGAEQAFREIADAGGGIFAKFEPGAEKRLAEMWQAIAAYAAGGRKALEQKHGH
jgi:hypothetical protein